MLRTIRNISLLVATTTLITLIGTHLDVGIGWLCLCSFFIGIGFGWLETHNYI